MNSKRRLLKKKLEIARELAITHSFDGSSSSIKEAIEDVDLYSRVLKETDPLYIAEPLVATIVVLIVIAVVGILWIMKFPQPEVLLSADTERLQTNLSVPWQTTKTISGSELHLDNVSEISDPGLGLQIHDPQGTSSITLTGGHVAIERLNMDGGGSFEVISSANDADGTLAKAGAKIQIAADDTSVSGVISAIGDVTVAAKSSGKVTVYKLRPNVPQETINFSSLIGHVTVLELLGVKEWSLGVVPCSSVSFSGGHMSGNEKDIPGLVQATLRFYDSPQVLQQFMEGERLLVTVDTGPQGAKTQISNSRDFRDGIHVSMDGRVQRVELGSSERKQLAFPSYLEHLRGQEEIDFFFGSIAAGWGALWGIRKTMFR